MVDTNMGWPMLAAEDGVVEAVGDRKPPKDGVNTGVGMEGGMSSKSSNRSKLDLRVGRGSGFFLTVLVVLDGLSSSSELDDVSDSESVSGFTCLTGTLGLVLTDTATGLDLALALATILTGSGSESEESSLLLLLLESDSESELESESDFPPDL